MKPSDLLRDLVQGRPVGRTLVLPTTCGFTALSAGHSVREYVSDGRLMARLQREAWEYYGYDSVITCSDVSLEAETIGSRLQYSEGAYPFLVEPAIRSLDELNKLKVPTPAQDGRMAEMITAVRTMKAEVADRALVLANVAGPLTIAGQLMGLERFLFGVVDEPDKTRDLLDFTAEVTLKYGRALLEAGADAVILYDPTASLNVLPKDIYRRTFVPRAQRIFEDWERAGNLVRWVHIVGSMGEALPSYGELDIEVVSLEPVVPVSLARGILPEAVLVGSIRSYDLMTLTPDEITVKMETLLNELDGLRPFLIGSGCEVPMEAKPENLLALVRAVREWDERRPSGSDRW